MKNISLKKIVIVLMLLFLLLGIIITIYINKIRTPKEMYSYIYSDEIDEGTFSPKMIHMVIVAYEGEVNPKAISKSTYYMITNRIPEYLNKCKDNKSLNDYFEKNSNSIYLATGINNNEQFKKLLAELKKVSGKLKLDCAEFDRETIKVNKNNLEVVLKIKYEKQEEILLNMRISNKESVKKPAIEFYKQ